MELGEGKIEFTNGDVFEGDLTNYGERLASCRLRQTRCRAARSTSNFVRTLRGPWLSRFRGSKVYGGTFEHNSMTGIGHMQYRMGRCIPVTSATGFATGRGGLDHHHWRTLQRAVD